MKRHALLFTFIICVFAVNGQNPVSWNYSVKKIKDKMFEVHLTATLQNGWHTYSQTTPVGGPVPTAITFSKNPLLNFEGSVREEGNLIKKYEEVFGIDVKYFSNKVDFVQTVTLKASAKTAVSGFIDYMVCTDERCLPPTKVPFKIDIR